MSAMVKLDESVYGAVTTLKDGCIVSMVCNLESNLETIQILPASLKDKFIHLMSKRGTLTDANISALVHDKVKVLDLADCEISDVGLQAACRCPHLRKIDLNANKESRTNISSAAIQQLAQSCKELQTVYLRRCLNITDEAIIALSQSCRMLRLLNLGGCRNITDQSLTALGQNCHFLESVNVANTQITDAGIFNLVSGPCSKNLKEVHINHCDKVTDEAVEAVLQYCPQINILLFHGCPNVTEQSRQALEDLTISRDSPMKQVTWTIY